jgi:hypothetical protein
MKKKRFLTILMLCYLTIMHCHGQTNDPMSLAMRIFARDTCPNLTNYITGDYDGHPNGTDLPDNASTDFKLLGQDENQAVVNLTIIDSTGKEFDTYLHFERDSVWKVAAFRALAMTGIVYQVVEMLENMTDVQVDSVIASYKYDTLGQTLFRSKMEYEFLLGNSRLTLASDNELISHFSGFCRT